MNKQQKAPELADLATIVSQYNLGNSACMRRVAAGDFDRQAACTLGRRYYPVCVHFPMLLSMCISRVRDERARILLVENLYEEHGEFNPELAHTSLFRRYLRALDINPEESEEPATGSPEERLIDEYWKTCSHGSAQAAVGCLYAFEKSFSGGMRCIAEGFRINKLVPEYSLSFFDVHAVDDVKHAQQIEEVLSRIVPSPACWPELCNTVRRSSRLLAELFDSIFV